MGFSRAVLPSPLLPPTADSHSPDNFQASSLWIQRGSHSCSLDDACPRFGFIICVSLSNSHSCLLEQCPVWEQLRMCWAAPALSLCDSASHPSVPCTSGALQPLPLCSWGCAELHLWGFDAEKLEKFYWYWFWQNSQAVRAKQSNRSATASCQVHQHHNSFRFICKSVFKQWTSLSQGLCWRGIFLWPSTATVITPSILHVVAVN